MEPDLDECAFDLYRRLGITSMEDDTKMQLHILECVGALVRAQRLRRCENVNAFQLSMWKIFWRTLAEISSAAFSIKAGDKLLISPLNPLLHLLNHFPDNRKAHDGRGWLPLHFAVTSIHCEENDIQNVCTGLSTSNSYNLYTDPLYKRTPFHVVAVVHDPNIKNIHRLRENFPSFFKAETSYGSIPLHPGSRFSNSVDFIQYLVDTYPTGASKQVGSTGVIPHHLVCKNPNKEACMILKLLVDVYPNGVRVQDNEGRLPLHFICTNYKAVDRDFSSRLECVKLLLGLYPEGALVRDASGKTPVHDICADVTPESEAILDLVLKGAPQSTRIQDSFGSLPLHEACAVIGPITAAKLSRLLKIYPEGASVFAGIAEECILPLHIAISYRQEASIVRMLADTYPDALSISSNSFGYNVFGNPLQVAAQFSDLDTIKLLYDLSPLSLHTITDSRTPFHIAARFNSCDVLRQLFEWDPSAVRRLTKEGSTPLHWLFTARHDCQIFDSMSDDADKLRFLLRVYPEASTVVDANGRTPLSLVDEGNTFALRVLLMTAPQLDPLRLRQLNYLDRRTAIFVFFVAKTADGEDTPFTQLRRKCSSGDVIRRIIGFL